VGQLAFDDSLGRQLEALYRTRDLLLRRRLIREVLAARPGERILDVGCGPGFTVAELLDDVGPEGFVAGVDRSPQMLALAAQRTAQHANVELHEADATDLPVADEDFDAAISVQVLEYVPDVAAALGQIHRALRAGGRVLVWDVDWATVSWHSRDEPRMERVLRAWDEHLAHASLPRTLAPLLRSAGFADVRMDAHAFATIELVPDAYGAGVFPLIEQYVAGREGIGPDVASAWAAEQRELAEAGEFSFACTQFCFAARKPA
jgi:ubiquinone/menaquinone biosynthesis C-methylase UbiE